MRDSVIGFYAYKYWKSGDLGRCHRFLIHSHTQTTQYNATQHEGFVSLYWGYIDWILIPSIRNKTSFKCLLSISISAWINVFMDKTSILIWNVGRLYKANNLYKTQSMFFHITKNWQSLQKSYFSNWNSQNEIHR